MESATPPPTLKVVIHIRHSPEFASRFLGGAYTGIVREALGKPTPAVSQPVSGQHAVTLSENDLNTIVVALPSKYPATTSLFDVGQDVERAFPRVPVIPVWSIQSPCSYPLPQSSRLFSDSSILADAWEAVRQQRLEDGEGAPMQMVRDPIPAASDEQGLPIDQVHLWLPTTAAYLEDLDLGLANDYRQWKHCTITLKYKLSTGLSENSSEFSAFEAQEKREGEILRRNLCDWEDLVSGSWVNGKIPAEMTSRDEREADIKARIQRLNETRNGMTEQATRDPKDTETIDWVFPELPHPEEDLVFPIIPPAEAAPIVGVHKLTHHPAARGVSPEQETEASFILRSGALLWGQLHTVFAGSRTAGFDSSDAPPPLAGGTIVQRILKYRAAARNGRWKIRKAYSNSGSENSLAEPRLHFGYVIYHESVDPDEILWRCAGKEWHMTGDGSPFKDILAVGRYDWSWISTPRDPSALAELLQDATGLCGAEGLEHPGLLDADDMGALRSRWGGFCMLADAEEFGRDFVQAFVRDCPPRGMFLMPGEPGVKVFEKRDGDAGDQGAFGAWMACDWTEYEFAWLVFSGKKHDEHIEADEMIAFVYDGSYDRFEGTRVSTDQ